MAKVPASIAHASNPFWKNKTWDPDVIPKTLEWHEPNPFAPIPASVYENATKNTELHFQKLKQLMDDGLAAHEKLLYGATKDQLSGVIVHDCSEHVPFGHGMLTALTWLLGQWKHGMSEIRYIAVGKGDTDRLEAEYVANEMFVAYHSNKPDTLFFKGNRVIEHDHRAGYYLLVCY